MTARELANSVPADSPLAEDVALLVSEGQRCREILRSLSQKGESDEHAPFTRVPLSNLLGAVADTCRRRPEVDLAITLERRAPESPEPQLVPTPELRHAFANLIDNALEFAASEVRIVLTLEPARVAVGIEDDGPGFQAEVLELLGEPYLSTRREAAASASACSSPRPCLREPARRCNLPTATRGSRDDHPEVAQRWRAGRRRSEMEQSEDGSAGRAQRPAQPRRSPVRAPGAACCSSTTTRRCAARWRAPWSGAGSTCWRRKGWPKRAIMPMPTGRSSPCSTCG